MDEFTNLVNSLKENEDNDSIVDNLFVVIDSVNDSNQYQKFDMLIGIMDKDLLKDVAFNIIVGTHDIIIVEKTLSALEYVIPRRLNRCLQVINDMEILEFLMTHQVVRFNLAYRNWEALRMSVLNNDHVRVRLFLASRKHMINVHSRGINTMNKSVVEIAVMYEHDDIIRSMIEVGIECEDEQYSKRINDYVRKIKTDMDIRKICLLEEIASSYTHKPRGSADVALVGEFFKNVPGDLDRLSSISVLLLNMQKIFRC